MSSFINSPHPPVTLSIPARINILGNPTDAVEGDFATLSAAVEIRAGASIGPHEHIYLEHIGQTEAPPLTYLQSALPLPYDGQHDLLKGAINRLYQFSPELQEKIHQQGFALKVWSDVPRQSGLGGSSLFVLITLGALREFYELDRRVHNDYILSELTQRVEEKELDITCGYADRYVPLFGGLGYLDYRGKLFHADIRTEPLTTFERLDDYITYPPLVAAATGVRHNSGDVHGRMRPVYLQEYNTWRQNGGSMPPMIKFMSTAWETAWRGKIALLENDLDTFGQLMNQNHALVNEMMLYCGFEDGAGWANNLFIQHALRHGALGAKLTGAGGGGSVFALVRPGEEETLMRSWGELAETQGLKDALIYRLKISRQGLTVHRRS